MPVLTSFFKLVCLAILALLASSLRFPAGLVDDKPIGWFQSGWSMAGLTCVALAAISGLFQTHPANDNDPIRQVHQVRNSGAGALAFALLGLTGALAPLAWLGQLGQLGQSAIAVSVAADSYGFWLALLALLLLACASLSRLAAVPGNAAWAVRAIPLLLGVWVLVFWQIGVVALDVPRVLLPSPLLIANTLWEQWDVLLDDFSVTVLRSALVGYILGCGGGFLLGILIDKSPFLQRGLLPVCALASSVPLVGIAPIMVMWFGFEWHSKAAVVALMTFFPMLISTFAGLAATGRMELDLMRSYAAGHARTLLLLRLPMALPFLFNGLKVASTLALIGAIVAEFFGSPTVGMGFRISAEAARMNMGLVWATIMVAALAGTVIYALIEWAERAATFWHPSQR